MMLPKTVTISARPTMPSSRIDLAEIALLPPPSRGEGPGHDSGLVGVGSCPAAEEDVMGRLPEAGDEHRVELDTCIRDQVRDRAGGARPDEADHQRQPRPEHNEDPDRGEAEAPVDQQDRDQHGLVAAPRRPRGQRRHQEQKPDRQAQMAAERSGRARRHQA